MSKDLVPNLAVPEHQVFGFEKTWCQTWWYLSTKFLDVEKLGTKLGGNLCTKFLDVEKLGAKLGGKSCIKVLSFENIVPNLVLRPFRSIVIDFRKSKTIFQGFQKLGATWC